MPSVSSERARWIAIHILPLEPQLRGWLKRVTPAGLEVDDLVQEAYAKLASLATVSNITQHKAYLYQIVKRLISNHVRRGQVVSIEAVAEVANLTAAQDEGFSPERILSGRQELERLYEAIGKLPAPYRSVFVMRKFDDRPQKMIAAELRISENIVERRLSRALQLILDHLNTNRGELEHGLGFIRAERRQRRDA